MTRVLGLDPGSIRTGWGVVELNGQRAKGIAAGVIRLPQAGELPLRLRIIFDEVSALIGTYAPQAVAVEDIFFAKYPQAALVLGHARGVALLAAERAGLPIAAYPPAVVKRAIVGRGRATKPQVAQLVGTMLSLAVLPAEDASDALAIALTHLNVMRFPKIAR